MIDRRPETSMPSFLLVAAFLAAPQSANLAVDLTPGRCIAAAEQLAKAVEIAHKILEIEDAIRGNKPSSPDDVTIRAAKEARVAHAEAMVAAIRAKYPKIAATDDGRGVLAGQKNPLPFAARCLDAPPSAMGGG